MRKTNVHTPKLAEAALRTIGVSSRHSWANKLRKVVSKETRSQQKTYVRNSFFMSFETRG